MSEETKRPVEETKPAETVLQDSQTENAAADELLYPVLVIDSDLESSVKVAGLNQKARWEKTFEQLDFSGSFDVKFFQEDLFSSEVGKLDKAALLVDGSFVIEPLLVETLLERGTDIKANEVVCLKTSKGCAPVLLVGAEAAATISADWQAGQSEVMQSLIDFASDNTSVNMRTLVFDKAFFWNRPTTKKESKESEWGLLQRLQWRPGGLVAQLLNRPVSIRMSRYMAATPITPNQTTILAFLIGLFGIYFLFVGQYWGAILGMLLIQLNSIVDGVDGELAHLRHQRSEFGGFLDSVCDELLNSLIYIATGFFLTNNGYWVGYVYLGLFAGIASLMYALTHWHCKIKHGLGLYWWWDAYKPRKRIQSEMTPYFYLRKLFCKDSIILLFLFAAVFSFLHYLVWIAAAAGLVTVVLLFIHIFIKRARW